MLDAFDNGKMAAFLSVEDISIMGKYIDEIQELGIRFAMLTWNYENQYGCSSNINQETGLSQKGKEIVKKLDKQNIIIDASHLSDGGIDDVLSIIDSPIIASHSNAREVYSKPRNLKKEHIEEIIKRKGVIGMNFFRLFIRDGEKVPLHNFFEHIEYILNLGGEESIVFGADFDGCDGLFPEGIKGIQSMSYIYEMMKHHGFDESIINKIFFENSKRFIIENLK